MLSAMHWWVTWWVTRANCCRFPPCPVLKHLLRPPAPWPPLFVFLPLAHILRSPAHTPGPAACGLLQSEEGFFQEKQEKAPLPAEYVANQKAVDAALLGKLRWALGGGAGWGCWAC